MIATEEQSENSSYIPDADGITRISKSSFMNYMLCRRQFWWRFVADIPKPPPTEVMIRGKKVHSVMERGMKEGPQIIEQAVIDEGLEIYDPVIESMTSLLHQIATDLGGFEIIESEVKHELFERVHLNLSGFERPVEIIWVGMIDAIVRHPNGGLILVELKTGNMGMSKLGRTRKELCYYNMILDKLGYDEITHFLYIAPDYQLVTDREDKLLLEGNKRGKELWLGNHNGIAILEPIGTRSINAFKKALSNTLPNLFSHQWDMNWNEWFCLEWCDFNNACQNELLGFSEAIV